MAELLPRPTYSVKPGTNFPEVRPFYWPTIAAGQWLILRLRSSSVPFIVCVVDNQLGHDFDPSLTVHLGRPSCPLTIGRQAIRNLKRHTGLLPVRCSH